VKVLHTSDWHVGKKIKQHSRIDEQRAVLREIVGIAREQKVDAVLVAGDLYETSVPSAEAQQLVVRTLLDLRATGAEVIAIAGNHDHALTFDAYRPLMAAAGIILTGSVRIPQAGGIVEFHAPSTGEPVVVAVLPFVSQNYAVSAAELVANRPDENAASYDELYRTLLRALVTGFRDDAVNLVLAHLTVTGGQLGGGERAAQTIFEYHVPATAFPPDAHYVALGHLHRRQTLDAACPVSYCGSPIAVDFGEQDNKPVVCLVEASPGVPAKVTDIPITAGRRMRTVHGTVAELAERAESFGEDWLRVYVREKARAGLTQEVQAVLPNAVHVYIDPDYAEPVGGDGPGIDRAGRSPAELFAEYCAAYGHEDARVTTLFNRLHDELSQPAEMTGGQA
jgi:exonuclease SbcD